MNAVNVQCDAHVRAYYEWLYWVVDPPGDNVRFEDLWP
jgi:hypothetical protein